MKQLSVSFFVGVALLPLTALATDQFYINNGTVTTAPQIDAVNFINNGTFGNTFFTFPYPYDTANTLNFTNNGAIFGAVGFRFDTSPGGNGTRKLAANFMNHNGGVVASADLEVITNNVGVGVLPNYLLISATNLINEGLLAVGADGTMQLTGTNVTLKRSGVEVNPITPVGSANTKTNFQPDIAVYDLNWGQSNLNFNSSSLISGSQIRSPRYPVRPPNNGSDQVILPFATTFFELYTNDLGGVTLSVSNSDGSTTSKFVVTNTVRQAIFVGMSDPNLQLSIGFSPGSDFKNPFQQAAILLELGSTNVISGQNEFADLYLADTLGSETNRGLLRNGNGTGTFRPANYLLSRIPANVGSPGNDLFFDPNFFYDSLFTNRLVESEYGGYLAFVDHVITRPPSIPTGTVTNLAGKIEIRSDSLDMTKTRVRGEGLIDIQTKHLIGSSNAFVDGESLTYSLGSTNGNLTFQNLAKTTTTRLQGDIKAWSGVWTNYQEIVTTLIQVGTNGPTPVVFTNYHEVRFHTLMVDANAVVSTLPVSVYDFIMHSTNLTVNDAMTIVKSMHIDAQSLTVNGSIALGGITINPITLVTEGDLEDWTAANTPNVKYFTNNGSISVPNEAHFGDDRTPPYSAFVNRGSITAFGQTINSDYLEIPGTLNSSAATTLITRSGKIENGSINSGGDVSVYADVIKFNHCSILCSSRLSFSVTNSLFDNGGNSGNAFTCRDGFSQIIKPLTGDLLGTAIQTFAPTFAEVDHVWAGDNLGASRTGFLNNSALGNLALVPEGFDPFFVFSGAGVNNGLYVDVLDLSQLSDYQNQLQIDPNLVIYYAAAKLGFTPPGNLEPEEYLDGQFGGHLRWVKDFAGPNSSVDVVINGQTVKVNRALRNSLIIDSDADGIANGLDFTPFGGVTLTSIVRMNPPPRSFLISWEAAAGTVYEIDYATNLVSPAWQFLQFYTNNAGTNGVVTIQDPAPSNSQRFYRVGYTPN